VRIGGVAEAESAAAEVARLRGADIRRMWLDDLDAFMEAYEAWEREEAAAQARLARQQLAARRGQGGKKGGKGGGGKKTTTTTTTTTSTFHTKSVFGRT